MPLNSMVVAVEAAVVATSGESAFEASALQSVPLIILAGTALSAICLEIKAAKRKIAHRDRIETLLQDHGFDERLLAPSTDTYCGRQAAKVACENYGYGQEFAQLCEARANQSAMTCLPHI